MSFDSKKEEIARRDRISYDRAAAILASSTRNASVAAKRKNPRLLRVPGGNRPKGK